MKFSVALAMAVAPLALAKAVHNVYPIRRDELTARKNDNQNSNAKNNNNNNNKGGNVGSNSILLSEANLGAEQAFLLGQALGAQQSAAEIALLQQALLLWVNPGGSAATTIINVQPAATQTVIAGAAGATQPAAPAVTSVAAGGSATTPSAPSNTVAATGTTHSVSVGAGGLAFSPSELTAAVGDTVIFTFVAANHTATQSAFATPCDVLAGGMDSGFQPNANGTVNPPPQVAMQVQVATPLWFFCRQAGHCGKGMVMSINPTADKTQAIFQSQAIAQNGTGAGSAITGGSGAPAAGNGTAATPPAASVSSAAAVGGAASLTATLGSAASATATAVAGGAGVQTGTGQIAADGSCVCAVQCAAGSFASAQQGINAFGGVPAMF